MRAESEFRTHGWRDALLARCQGLARVPTAVVRPWDVASLQGAVEAAEHDLIIPILIGPGTKIKEPPRKAAWTSATLTSRRHPIVTRPQLTVSPWSAPERGRPERQLRPSWPHPSADHRRSFLHGLDPLRTLGHAALSQTRFWPGHGRTRWHSRRTGASRSHTTETVSNLGEPAHGSPIMMTAAEYRTKATEARLSAEASEDPHFKEAFSLHALKWASLAITADIQAQQEIAAAREDE